ncbi:MAG: DUF4177 domain-containing protein [Firmicutes bacterium]|nr:DUF4177 domain-containing protein [Candidatus Colimorpha enterica]
MKNYEYKIQTYGIAFSSRKTYKRMLNECINENAKDGWRLHSFDTCMGDILTVIFEREIEN